MQKFFVFILLAISLVGCGDLFQKKKKESSKTISRLNACDLDAKSLKKILEQDITQELLCAEDKLNLFVEVVRTDRPGLLSLSHLKAYLRQMDASIDEKIVKFIDEFFLLKTLLYGDSKLYMTKADITKLINLFIDINRLAVSGQIKTKWELTDNTSIEDYQQKKLDFTTTMSLIGERVLREMIAGNSASLNIPAIINKVNTLLDDEDKIESFEKYLFIKDIFYIGQKEILTNNELQSFLRNIDVFSKVAFDMHAYEYVNWEEEKLINILTNIRADIAGIIVLLPLAQEEAVVFNLQDVFNLIHEHKPEWDKYQRYTEVIKKMKSVFLLNSENGFSRKEIKHLFSQLLLKTADKLLFAQAVFNNNKQRLERQEGVVRINPTRVLTAQQREFVGEINFVLSSYKLFADKNLVPEYIHGMRRSSSGLIELLLAQDFTKYFVKKYGTVTPLAKGGHQMTMEQLAFIIADLKEIFIGEEIMHPLRVDSSVQNLTLLTTLFQYHSDGDSIMELDEMTEFLVTVGAAYKMATLSQDYFRNVCQFSVNDTFSSTCFNQHFNSFLNHQFDGIKFSSKMPGLYTYLQTAPTDERDEFIRSTEGFTRACTHFENGEEVPLGFGDLFTFFGGLLSIEQTHIRFDADRDNTLNVNETEVAYGVYEDAIKALVDSEFLKKRSRAIFYYLIRKRSLPETTEETGARAFFRNLRAGAGFAGFLMRANKEAPADRVTLAAVLKAISDASPVNQENPFNCELLR